MLMVVGKWQTPEELREPIRAKWNKEIWRKLDSEMDMWSGKGKIPQETLNEWQELENSGFIVRDSTI